ncbi:MAG: hypothetical protein L6N96_06415 [Candidatus Methylarchaceae archaeon HK02M2]|nr:hypothetical protein [Candidatus Methylarchaceae archaeon HK02M2]
MEGSLGKYMVSRATGLLGDFRMPVCARIITREGIERGWLLKLTNNDIRRILRRYKEHVTFWNINSKKVSDELALFYNALDCIGIRSYTWENFLKLYDSLPAKRVKPNDKA